MIIATGSVPRLPDIPGVEAGHVFNIVDLFQAKRDPGADVIVAGGGNILGAIWEGFHAARVI